MSDKYQQIEAVKKELARILDGEESEYGWRKLNDNATITYIHIREHSDFGKQLSGLLENQLFRQRATLRNSEEQVIESGGYVLVGNDRKTPGFAIDWKAADNILKRLYPTKGALTSIFIELPRKTVKKNPFN